MIDYNTDFYGWTQEQAALLRAGRLSELDMENLIEEVETMGRSEKRALESRLTILLLHMLKWQYQPARRGRSWKLSIDEQRLQFQRIFIDNPGLKSEIDKIMLDAYQLAILKAANETGLETDTFPPECPWSIEQATVSGFYPE